MTGGALVTSQREQGSKCSTFHCFQPCQADPSSSVHREGARESVPRLLLSVGVLAQMQCITLCSALHTQGRRLTSSLASLLGLACQDCFRVPKTWSITSLGSNGSLLGPSAHQSRHCKNSVTVHCEAGIVRASCLSTAWPIDLQDPGGNVLPALGWSPECSCCLRAKENGQSTCYAFAKMN